MSIVTAVIPCYNAGGYLAEAIASVKAQTVPVAEILVVDDGSDDGSPDRARAMGARVLSTGGRRGPSTGRNLGAAAAGTRYIAFLDADDQWLPIHNETLLGLLEVAADAAAAFGRIQNFDAEGDIPTLRRQRPGTEARLLDLLVDNPIAQSAAIVDRGRLLEVGGYREELRFAEDFDLWLRLAERYRIIGTDLVTCRYRIHAEQSSRDLLEMTLAGWDGRLACRDRLVSRGEFTQQHEAALLEAAEDDLRSAWVLSDKPTLLFLLDVAEGLPGSEALKSRIRTRMRMLPLRRLALTIRQGLSLQR